ncbi:arrestin homolog isoform X1 [Penaeus monodon]|uniref:arrestin homolog isoform X1 n=2 Tax=Penaeus monodon TaxID=6687 RepID=UPI0018A72115|nr:arrestin homolog isoform X1 [Penaeus monodon]
MVVKLQVFKKSSPNSKVTLFLTKRDYLDHVTHVDPIEGVLVFDPSCVQERNVYVQIALSFRFGREDDESMGYNFTKTMYLHTIQLYPPVTEFVPSEIQRNLISKLGNFAFPFLMEFPKLSSPSYVMQQGWEDEGSLMGVEFEVMGYIGATEHDMPKRSTARLLIRRLQECPKQMYEAPVPRGNITKSFLTTAGNVSIEASLSKPVYEPEEDIPVKIAIRNDTNRDIKRLKMKVVQLSEVPMFSDRQTRDKTIIKYDDPINLAPGACTTRGVTLMCCVPSRTARGKVFLQGGLRADCDDVIAPTTILNPEVDKNDVFGVYVSYVVRVKASLGTLRGDCVLDIPFVLAVPQER